MNTTTRFSAALCAVTLAAASASAAEPAIRLERGYVLPSNAQFKGFRVPTVDVNGATRYYDIVVDLTVNEAGKIGSNAIVTSLKSPPIPGDKFVAGIYVEPSHGYLCTVSASILSGTRTEGALSCRSSGFAYITIGWTSGDIAGHPFELDLRAAGIDSIPGYELFSWGKVGGIYDTWWGCFTMNDIVSARQVGNQISLNSYDAGNIAKCGVTLNLVP